MVDIFEQTMHELGQEVKRQTSYGQKTRRYMKWVVASIIFNIILSFGLGIVAFQANHTAHKVSQNTSHIYLDCRSNNQARKIEQQLWNYILKLSATAPARPNESQVDADKRHKQATDFQLFLDKTFAQLNCDKKNNT